MAYSPSPLAPRSYEFATHTGFLERELSAHSQFVVIYHEHAYAQLPVVSFTRELLEMNSEAQAKALIKVRRLEQTLLSPLAHLRAPP